MKRKNMIVLSMSIVVGVLLLSTVLVLSHWAQVQASLDYRYDVWVKATYGGGEFPDYTQIRVYSATGLLLCTETIGPSSYTVRLPELFSRTELNGVKIEVADAGITPLSTVIQASDFVLDTETFGGEPYLVAKYDLLLAVGGDYPQDYSWHLLVALGPLDMT